MSIFSTVLKSGYKFEHKYDSAENAPFVKCVETFKGMCIAQDSYTRDGYSHQLMYVWDTIEEKPKWIEYQSERVKNPDAYKSYIDATPEIIIRAKQYEQKIKFDNMLKERKLTAVKLINIHKKEVKITNKFRLSMRRLRTLRTNTNEKRYLICLNLLISPIRNDFKKSIRSQILEWLEIEGPRKDNLTPLSYKQWVAIEQYTTVKVLSHIG